MTDDEWEQQRSRAVLAAFQTGRPIFADSEGELRYADGDQAPVAEDVGVAKQPVPRAIALLVRAERASRFAFVASVGCAIASTVAAFWQPWQLACAAVLAGSAVVWRRVNQRQRAVINSSNTSKEA